jgi:hypothetical protein
MSHEAVQKFFKEIAESDEKAVTYQAFTKGFIYYDEPKIVTHAATLGHKFKIQELRLVRLTNICLGILGEIKYYSDYAPTPFPEKPDSPEDFYKTHQRNVGCEWLPTMIRS